MEGKTSISDSAVEGDVGVGIKAGVVNSTTFNIIQKDNFPVENEDSSMVFPMRYLNLNDYHKNVFFEQHSPSVGNVKNYVEKLHQSLSKVDMSQPLDFAAIELNAFHRLDEPDESFLFYSILPPTEQITPGQLIHEIKISVEGTPVFEKRTNSIHSKAFIVQLFSRFLENENLGLEFLKS